jgi:hypothetical protein
VGTLADTVRQTQAEFIQSDLQLAFTFVEMAKTYRTLGRLDAAEQAVRHTRKAYHTIRHMIAVGKFDKQTVAELTGQCDDLERALSALGN